MRLVFDGQYTLLENSVSRYTRNLVTSLARICPALNITLLLFTRRNESDIRAENTWLPDGVHLYCMAGEETPYVRSRFEVYRRIWHWSLACRRLKADVFHAHYTSMPFPFGGGLVTTLHDVFEWVPSLGRAKGRRTLRKMLDKLTYRRASIIAVSEHSKRDFLTYLDKSHPRIEAIQSGVEPKFTPTPSPSDQAVCERLGLQPGAYVLYIGDLSPRKNVTTLIRAFARCLDELPIETKLVLTKGVWHPTPEGELAAQLGIADRLLFIGHAIEAELPSLYRQARVFVFPSRYEGFGFPNLEAMASGTPVITTNVSSMPEVVGDAALTLDPDDVDGFATAIIRVFHDPDLCHALSERGRARATNFTWERTARGVLRHYQRYHCPTLEFC